jgi:hypothetical protein
MAPLVARFDARGEATMKKVLLVTFATASLLSAIGCSSRTSTGADEADTAHATLALGMRDGAASPTGQYTGDYAAELVGSRDEVEARVAETEAELRKIASPDGLIRVTITTPDETDEFFVGMLVAPQIEALAASFERPASQIAPAGPEHVATTSSAITRNQCESDTCGGMWNSWCRFGYQGSCGWACIICGHECILGSNSECRGTYDSY